MHRFIGLLVCTLSFFLVGCSGHRSHDVVTGEDGTLEGLVITPAPQSLSIPLDTDFDFTWQAGYAPPREFHLALRKVNADGTTIALYTEVRTLGTGHYRLCPTGYLPSGTFLLLTITGGGESLRAMYLTENSRAAEDAPPRKGGQAEHTVIVGE